MGHRRPRRPRRDPVGPLRSDRVDAPLRRRTDPRRAQGGRPEPGLLDDHRDPRPPPAGRGGPRVDHAADDRPAGSVQPGDRGLQPAAADRHGQRRERQGRVRRGPGPDLHEAAAGHRRRVRRVRGAPAWRAERDVHRRGLWRGRARRDLRGRPARARGQVRCVADRQPRSGDGEPVDHCRSRRRCSRRCGARVHDLVPGGRVREGPFGRARSLHAVDGRDRRPDRRGHRLGVAEEHPSRLGEHRPRHGRDPVARPQPRRVVREAHGGRCGVGRVPRPCPRRQAGLPAVRPRRLARLARRHP
jgi:hypothetical protein